MKWLYMLAEGISPVKTINAKDVMFYIFLSLLVVVVIFLTFLYTKSSKFKIKKRKEIEEQNKAYEPPTIVQISHNCNKGKKE